MVPKSRRFTWVPSSDRNSLLTIPWRPGCTPVKAEVWLGSVTVGNDATIP
jgi:hypothetical protein